MEIKHKTPTELLKLSTDTKNRHDKIKEDIDILLEMYDKISEEINNKINELEEVEKIYVEIVDEIESR